MTTPSDEPPGRPGSLLVNTIPKSGTYLVSALLQRLGAHDSGLHSRDDHFWEFGGRPQLAVIADPNQFIRHELLVDSIRLLGAGEFAVGHLADAPGALRVLDEHQVGVVFLVRDLRSSLISNMRFLSDPRRRQDPLPWMSIEVPTERFRAFLEHHGKRYLRGVREQLGWLETGRPVIRFEELYGDHGDGAQTRAVDDLVGAAGLDVEVSQAVDVLTTEVIGASTRTYSGRRSEPEEYVSEESARLLDELGVPALNRLLGYGDR